MWYHKKKKPRREKLKIKKKSKETRTSYSLAEEKEHIILFPTLIHRHWLKQEKKEKENNQINKITRKGARAPWQGVVYRREGKILGSLITHGSPSLFFILFSHLKIKSLPTKKRRWLLLVSFRSNQCQMVKLRIFSLNHLLGFRIFWKIFPMSHWVTLFIASTGRVKIHFLLATWVDI
jgi:hypothetical protein